MTEQDFRQMLKDDRYAAGQALAGRKVEEWMQDGEEEVVRVLAYWISSRVNLGNDDEVVGLAESTLLSDDEANE